jgi:vacuolar-type H+-ATPase subunit D/Vma8
MKRERKTKCDQDFRNQIVQANLGKSHCQAAATAYYLAVTYGGCTFFRAIRDAVAVREKWQTDFEAILKWLEENPDQAKQIEGELVIERLATVEAGKDNRLEIKERRMSVVASDPSRRSRSEKSERLLVNGIDLSDASLDASLQDVERALNGLKVETVPVR